MIMIIRIDTGMSRQPLHLLLLLHHHLLLHGSSTITYYTLVATLDYPNIHTDYMTLHPAAATLTIS